MTSTQTLKDLLQLLARRKPGATWKIACIYYDGVGEPLYEICLYYPGPAGRVRKRLVFKWHSGEITPNGCHTSHSGDATHIEDALLDLINAA